MQPVVCQAWRYRFWPFCLFSLASSAAICPEFYDTVVTIGTPWRTTFWPQQKAFLVPQLGYQPPTLFCLFSSVPSWPSQECLPCLMIRSEEHTSELQSRFDIV